MCGYGKAEDEDDDDDETRLATKTATSQADGTKHEGRSKDEEGVSGRI